MLRVLVHAQVAAEDRRLEKSLEDDTHLAPLPVSRVISDRPEPKHRTNQAAAALAAPPSLAGADMGSAEAVRGRRFRRSVGRKHWSTLMQTLRFTSAIRQPSARSADADVDADADADANDDVDASALRAADASEIDAVAAHVAAEAVDLALRPERARPDKGRTAVAAAPPAAVPSEQLPDLRAPLPVPVRRHRSMPADRKGYGGGLGLDPEGGGGCSGDGGGISEAGDAEATHAAMESPRRRSLDERLAAEEEDEEDEGLRAPPPEPHPAQAFRERLGRATGMLQGAAVGIGLAPATAVEGKLLPLPVAAIHCGRLHASLSLCRSTAHPNPTDCNGRCNRR